MSETKETEWVLLVRERYEPTKDVKMSYEDECNFLCLLNAPEQYGNEDQMLEYARRYPNITMKELVKFWDEITPDGLPPCASEWEDTEEDE